VKERKVRSKKRIRVVVVDDSPLALTAICSFLENQREIEIVGTANDGFELLEMAETLKPDLVITDLHMPRMSGLECTLLLHNILPATRVIVFTELDSPLAGVVCLEAGADGCVLKEHMSEKLFVAIRRLFPWLAQAQSGWRNTA
jgi:DNA-binding NarL/FixJ family response regulator